MYVFHECLALVFNILKHHGLLIDCLCMAPLVFAMTVTSMLTCHIAVFGVCICGLYLVLFSVWTMIGTLSRQYLNFY